MSAERSKGGWKDNRAFNYVMYPVNHFATEIDCALTVDGD